MIAWARVSNRRCILSPSQLDVSVWQKLVTVGSVHTEFVHIFEMHSEGKLQLWPDAFSCVHWLGEPVMLQ